MIHGFTQLTVVPTPPLKAKSVIQWIIATPCIMISQSTQFVPLPLWKQRFSVQWVITTPCHQPHVRFDISHNMRLCRYPFYSEGLISIGSCSYPASNIKCESWVHKMEVCAFTPLNAKAEFPVGHCHTLTRASCESHGFTQYTVVPLPLLG